MGHRAGGRPPYATACLIHGFAVEGEYAPYVRGRLALAGIDSRVPLATWLDAVYAIVADAPHNVLGPLDDQLTLQSGRLRPDRDTWGMSPGQIRMQGRLTGQGRR